MGHCVSALRAYTVVAWTQGNQFVCLDPACGVCMCAERVLCTVMCGMPCLLHIHNAVCHASCVACCGTDVCTTSRDLACSWVVGIAILAATHSPSPATVAPRTAAVYSGTWAHGQVLDASRGCSSRSYLHGPVTASPATWSAVGWVSEQVAPSSRWIFLWCGLQVAWSRPM